MKHNYLTFMLAMLMSIATSVASVFEMDGIYYEITSSTNPLTVAVSTSAFSYTGSVTIPESVTYDDETYSVTSIGDYAFDHCTGLTSVTIPNSVTSIGVVAFQGCSGLTSVTIPNSVTSIGKSAFYQCYGLKNLVFEDGDSQLSLANDSYNNFFYYCPLETLYLGRNISYNTSYGYSPFCRRNTLTSVTIGNSVTSIGGYAFYDCNGLTSVTIPNSVTSIGNSAFSSCSGLTSVTIPNSVTNIGGSAFSGCSGLTSVTIPNSVTNIGGSAFYGCTGLTGSLTIPNSVTSIGSSPFAYCSGLESIVVNSGNTVYDSREGCNAIIETASNTLVAGCKNTIIPNSVTSIGEGAFRGCSGLISITIPTSVTSIGNYAFPGCSGLESIVVNSGNTVYDSREGCNAIIETASNTLVAGCKNTIIPNSVTNIDTQAFYACTGLTSITIGNSVTSIGDYAFSGCTGLNNLVFEDGDSGLSLGKEPFNACTFETLYMGRKLSFSIKYPPFAGTAALNSVIISNSVTSIGMYEFRGCPLRNLMIKRSTPPSLSDDAFTPQLYYHTTLYVPMDAWDAYAYDSNWYQFINIRETAMSEEEVNTDRAYTLMNAKTFTYAVYDPLNDCIGSIKSIGALDENNPNHSWQTLDVKGQKYLYNIGARRFAVPTSDGIGLRLLDNADSITMTDNEDGIVLNGHAETPWALVSNERMSIDKNAEENVTGLKAIDNEQLTIDNVYDLSGRQQGKMQRGVNLLRMSDGTTKKVLVK